ncbi:uncharacterized protein E0L32_002287 [Thyridium curvatum]|uniref:NmrA-like domain-containing protein n=1 Tax=Thyridium curvatum TaxID=1093900 RepID=A0A507APN0_9PEZI|nr:uncharacterized protein E0L32_002287 [Thyridium curvatum]TPX06791.1 hypothetical protein E0L32_002287 [Thyridium curvatum]
MSPQTVFVCGITGTQGGAVAHRIFTKPGWVAHGLVRNPDAETARKLTARGAKLFPTPDGYDDDDTLAKAMAGCTAVFIAMMPDFADPDHEIRQVRSILKHAREAGAKRVVLSTSFLADRPWEAEGWHPDKLFAKFFLAKNKLEGMVKEASGFESWTILRPGFFMANFLPPNAIMYPDIATTRVWKTALLPDTRVDMIDELDIGAFAVAAIDDPGKFNKQEIEIAGQPLTPAEIARQISQALGKEFKAEFYTVEEIEAQKENPFIQGNIAARTMSKCFNEDKANSYGIRFGTFEEFLQRRKEDFVKFYA